MTFIKLLLAVIPAVAAYTYASGADSYVLYILATVGFYTMVGVGLNVLLGLTGQVSLGHVGFYAIGAYTVAILTTDAGLGYWPALLLAVILTGIIGVLLSIPALRVSGPYLAMITIAFAFIVEHGAVEWRELTGGASGLMNIPPVGIFSYEFSELDTVYLVITMTALTLFLYWRFADSAWGLAMRAVRDSEIAGQSLGLNPVMIRAAAFGLSAMAAGLAGGLYSPITAFVSPSSFSFFQSILFLLVVIIGAIVITVSLVLGFFAFLALSAVVLVAAAAMGIRLWWAKRQMPRNAGPTTRVDGEFIEGEFHVVKKDKTS